ncbi:hypothetical protein [Flavobacterium caeni]|uniref:hypothetical protein n=1 Tax=Flavobacterium caeni TaxID=490189 RepID=UPI001113140B|nr:hypothetical protein [Flavobacterium caeni]
MPLQSGLCCRRLSFALTQKKQKVKARKSQAQKLRRFSLQTANRSLFCWSQTTQLYAVLPLKPSLFFNACYLMAAGAQGKCLFYFWLARCAKNPHEGCPSKFGAIISLTKFVVKRPRGEKFSGHDKFPGALDERTKRMINFH